MQVSSRPLLSSISRLASMLYCLACPELQGTFQELCPDLLDQARLPLEPGSPSMVQSCSTSNIKAAKPVSSFTSSYNFLVFW